MQDGLTSVGIKLRFRGELDGGMMQLYTYDPTAKGCRQYIFDASQPPAITDLFELKDTGQFAIDYLHDALKYFKAHDGDETSSESEGDLPDRRLSS